MIKPVQQHDALLADVRSTRGDDGFRLWWLGQSGYLLQWAGKHLLLDPYLSDSLTIKYAATDKPHVRMTELVVSPHQLDFLDVVTSSHNHTDHLDADTLKPLFRLNQNLSFVVPEANRAETARRADVDPARPVGFNDGVARTVGGFEFTGIAAAHNNLDRDAAGNHVYLGYVVRFGPWTIYHSGDTLRYPGMTEKLAPYRVDLALLPINGDRPERRVAGNLDGPQAAQLARDIGARVVIPCHYDQFEFNTADPRDFAAACEKIGQPYRILRAGERWNSTELD